MAISPEKHLKKITQALDRDDIDKAAEELGALLKINFHGTLDYIRQSQILMRLKNNSTRFEFLNRYITEIIKHSQNDGIIGKEQIYASFSDLIASVRDSIAKDASIVALDLLSNGFAHGIEACCANIASMVRTYGYNERNSKSKKANPTENSARIADALHETGGIVQLLNIMIPELNRAALAAKIENPPRKKTALSLGRAARRLRSLAEDWQILSDIRQRIAFGLSEVIRIERGPQIVISPANIDHASRRLISARRLALMGWRRHSSSDLAGRFKPLVKYLIAEVSKQLNVEESETLFQTVESEILDDIASMAKMIDIVLIRSLPTKSGDLLRGLWVNYFLIFTIRSIVRSTIKSQSNKFNKYLIKWPRKSIIELIAKSAMISDSVAKDAIDLMTSDFDGRRPTDLATRPWISFDSDTIGVLGPFAEGLNAFMETRRLLAQENHTSLHLGKAYEGYIRQLLKNSDFVTANSSIELIDHGRPITDIDVLAYKDGIFFLIQAKYMAEPDSHYAYWKSIQEINAGVKQCLKARGFVQKNFKQLLDSLPIAPHAEKYEVCCLVVTSSIIFGGDGAWPVFVVDDTYMEHVLVVKQERIISLDGKVVEARPLFKGDFPTGEEFRDLMMSPRYLDVLALGPTALIPRTVNLRGISIIEYEPMEGMIHGEPYAIEQ